MDRLRLDGAVHTMLQRRVADVANLQCTKQAVLLLRDAVLPHPQENVFSRRPLPTQR
jgi:hypothetical protein